MLSVMLAVAALTAVSLLSDRIDLGLKRDAAKLLGAQAVLSADQPMPEAWLARVQALGLQASRTAVFSSMARATDDFAGNTRLVSVKAVEAGYPLRGGLTLRGADGTTMAAPTGGPSAGTVWVDEAVLLALDVKLGGSLWLGDAAFKVAAIIGTEPDRGAGFMSFSPRVMLPWADLPATGLIQPASRVSYRLLVAEPSGASQQALPAFMDWARQAVQDVRGTRLETLADGNPEMNATLSRAGSFLRLVALLSVVMSAVVVAMVARNFANQRLDEAALLRVMGVPQRTMLVAYVLELLLAALLGGLAGLLLGGLFHLGLISLLTDLIQVQLPAPSIWPFVLGMAMSVSLVIGFGISPIIQLARVPAMRVMRRDLGPPLRGAVLAWGFGLALFLAVLTLAIGEVKLTLIAVGGMLAALGVLALLTWVLLRFLQAALDRHAGQHWPAVLRHAMRSLLAQPAMTVVQTCALSLGLLSMFLLVLIRGDLIQSWRQATPPDAPNRFVINIQPDQAQPFQAALKTATVERYDWYPMARARLMAINGKAVNADQFEDQRAQRLVEREFNLSHAADMPSHNSLVAGQYKAAGDASQQMSLEVGLAKTLGVVLGDSLQFDMAGQTMTFTVTSLRKVNWASMRVNFFAMVPVAQVPDWPVTYISAYRQPAQSSRLDQQLVQAFPNLTVVDMTQLLTQVQTVLDQVILAVESLFVFSLTTGLLIVMVGIWSTREQRAKDLAIMRAMGASTPYLNRIQRVELLMLGALAGLLASVAALGIGWALASQIFEFAWQPPWWGVGAGVLVGCALVLLVGWWSLRSLVRRPVMQTLRQATG